MHTLTPKARRAPGPLIAAHPLSPDSGVVTSTSICAGGTNLQHAEGIVVSTAIRAGGLTGNHAETIVRPAIAGGRGVARRRLAAAALVGGILVLLAGPTGSASAAGPPCPADSTYNKQTRMCEAPPTPACAAGFTLDADGVCTRAATQGCPAGSGLSAGMCVGPAPAIFCGSATYDPQADACRRTRCSGFNCTTEWSPATHVCETGFTYNSFRRQCVAPTRATCTQGTLNASTGQCELAATPTCAAGFSLNTDGGAAVCQAAPLRGRSGEDHGTGSACPDDSPNSTGTPPNCGNGRGGTV